MEVDVALLLKYPLIVRSSEEDGNWNTYRGSIHVNGEDYVICITETCTLDFKLSLPREFKHFNAELDAEILKLEPKNIITVLDTLSLFIASKMPFTTQINHCKMFKHILYEYSDFTKFYINLKSCYLSHDLSKISISTLDQVGREHSLEVSVNFNDKNVFNMSSYDLPQDKEMFKASSSLKDIHEQFLTAIETFQPFFDAMNVFDTNCWILDPAQPTKSCCYRRISIEYNFSVVITLDPANVSRLPDFRFLGPERVVERYRDALNANIIDWEPENGIFNEILKLLGIENFPPKPEMTECGPDLLMENGDCNICFSSRLNDELPDVVCKNKVCEKCYHSECLYEWLMSVNARRFFSEVIGLCPNCEKNISCPIPK